MIEVADKEKCCGCTACASVCPTSCISMENDEEGFLYPNANAAECVGCGQCEQVCPIANPVAEQKCAQVGYVVRAGDEDVLIESTSGGAFTIIAQTVLAKGGIAIGVGFGEDGMPRHKSAQNSQELAELRGSKYVQSDLLDTLVKVKLELQSGKIVLFSGTPCQVEGLLSFLGNHPENLICVDVVCHAVPSPLVYSRYLEYVGRRGFARFRDKTPYGYQYSQMSFADESGARFFSEGVETSPYLKAFFQHLSVRPSCYSCAFRKRFRRSDYTLWDCWDAHSYSAAMDSDLGATKVLCHTEKAKALASELFAHSDFAVEAEPDLLVKGEKEIFEPPSRPERRNEFFRDCLTIKDSHELFSKWFPVNGRVVVERNVRRLLARFGLLGKVKNFLKGIVR
ncbi:Coenzyme F420 hydrogenase/dehydrogenase, beta subunit C-terminal domain [Arabiibacter massiliensis]|uniref:Coenzyme F420 hydrogenase/dehydrogenase, beta subunit C-terminal domain n=1 Tax=Arabiibacter massiliensis TaxID=1870985 RepID=UPI0009BB99AE|nr:Coenzyme F420 hydrogenase/dehydrogenase, beta subunit C-terminal domain [Arabiibacter massiliensis]